MAQVTNCFQKGYLLPSTLERLSEISLSINERLLDSIKYVLVSKVKQHLTSMQPEGKEMESE